MRIDQTKVCANCPFRKDSIRGWLGPWTIEAIIHSIGVDEHPCHMTVRRGDHLGEGEKVQGCVGAAIHMNLKCQMSRDPLMRKLQDKVKRSSEKELILERTNNFVDHHNVPGVRKVRQTIKDGIIYD